MLLSENRHQVGQKHVGSSSILLQKLRSVLTCLFLEWFSITMQQNNKMYWKYFPAIWLSSLPVSIFKSLQLSQGNVHRKWLRSIAKMIWSVSSWERVSEEAKYSTTICYYITHLFITVYSFKKCILGFLSLFNTTMGVSFLDSMQN